MRLASSIAALLVVLAASHVSLAEAAEATQREAARDRTPADDCPTGVIHHHHCVCKAEGAKATNGDECCSGSIGSKGLCCGDLDGPCANSGCCGLVVCDELAGTCVLCFEEGHESSHRAECCSFARDDASGLCCGEGGESCAVSGCCAGDDLCHDGLCVTCLPDGTSPDSPDQCCSHTAKDGTCCGELGSSCAESGCCPEGLVCHQGNCVDCLVEGTSTVDGDLCCSARAVDNVCCGENGDTCANSLCCADGICADGACIPCFNVGDVTPSPDACCTHAADEGHCCVALGNTCLGTDECCSGAFCDDFACAQCRSTGAACTDTSECCTGECCEGHCREEFNDTFNCGSCGHACAPPEECQDGLCGVTCSDLTACGSSDIFCTEPALHCVSFCGLEGGYLLCCPDCPPGGGPFAGTCGGDSGCCCGTCDYVNHVCMH